MKYILLHCYFRPFTKEVMCIIEIIQHFIHKIGNVISFYALLNIAENEGIPQEYLG
jgi:hypothetical protein